jgi:hypothetical protein
MFNVEASFAEHARKHGRKQAIEYIADVNEFTQRYLPKESNSKKRRGESTTGKVYVLRPAKYGGNVILDWDRVQAHVSWRAPRELKPEDLRRDPMARRMRQQSAGGPLAQRCLLLYWPPLKADDPQRTGEDVLWVGPRLADEYLWQYIRTFMEAGIDAVPAPNAYEWLRKGFGSPGDVMSEIELQSFKAIDRLEGRDPNSPSAKTVGMALASAPWSPFHSLSQRLCYWPTFPEEWNSDCGQKRRESGLGPQEPLRWKAK